MSFNLSNWARQSVSLNTGEVLVDTVPVGGPAFFTYRSVGDTAAQIAAANYFANVVYDLSVDDLIYIQGSDAVNWLVVATVDRDAQTITTATAGFVGTVGTANIQDGAITAAKLGALAVTTAAINANAVTSAKLATNVLQYAAVPITDAQFNGMYAAPVALVAAAGANTLIVLEQCQLMMTYSTAAFAAGGVVAVQYDSTVNGAGVIASTTQAAAAFQATASTTFTLNAGVVALPFATTVNKGLYLSNITGAFTTGESSFVAHVWYRVVPTV